MNIDIQTGNGLLDRFIFKSPLYCEHCEKEIAEGSIYFDDGYKIRCYSCWEHYKENLDEQAYRINE